MKAQRSDDSPAASPEVRCAIYTRCAVDRGSGGESDSLATQRKAAEAYVAGRKHKGWTCIPTRYDDRGYSGATMDRPGLKQLLADIDAGHVDWHQYQVLTKRSDRLLERDPQIPWAPNIWMGVSVESQDYTYRIDHLRQTHAGIKFLSLEPLLGSLPDLDLRKIDWVIVGGESGPGARPMDPTWVIDIRDQCRNANVPFFFKQWGGVNKKQAGRLLEGRTWDEMPRRPKWR